MYGPATFFCLRFSDAMLTIRCSRCDDVISTSFYRRTQVWATREGREENAQERQALGPDRPGLEGKPGMGFALGGQSLPGTGCILCISGTEFLGWFLDWSCANGREGLHGLGISDRKERRTSRALLT